MENQKIIEKVELIICSLLKIDGTFGSSRQDIASWDSIKHIEIVFALEDEFQIEFSSQEISELTSTEQISNTIISKLS